MNEKNNLGLGEKEMNEKITETKVVYARIQKAVSNIYFHKKSPFHQTDNYQLTMNNDELRKNFDKISCKNGFLSFQFFCLIMHFCFLLNM